MQDLQILDSMVSTVVHRNDHMNCSPKFTLTQRVVERPMSQPSSAILHNPTMDDIRKLLDS